MDVRQRILAAVCGIGLLILIIELVRRRKLKEEYSALWLLAGVVIVVFGLAHSLLAWVTRLIGAGWTSSTLFFFGILFVVLLCLQFSVKISALENRLKNLAQQLALLEAKKDDSPPSDGDDRPGGPGG